ncbi:MAG: hypothetical protein AB8B79_14115 [Granulosicoccus sp.]
MDKPTSPAYMPPNKLSDLPAHRPGIANSGQWQSTEKNSFESALNRISSKNSRAQEANNSRNSDVKVADSLDDESLIGGAQQSTDESLLSTDALQDNPQSVAHRIAGSLDTEVRDTLLIDMTLGSMELPGGMVIEGFNADANSSAAGSAQASSAGSTLSAETVAQMMARLERAPGNHDGHWRFAVLNDQAGITAMQLQRSIQGSWRVNVSFSASAQLDEQEQADELKLALLKEGHDVESVVISRLAAHLASADD